jgi:hypothetical protein
MRGRVGFAMRILLWSLDLLCASQGTGSGLVPLLRCFWFRYLAAVVVLSQKQDNPESVQDTSGPKCEEAKVFALIEYMHDAHGDGICDALDELVSDSRIALEAAGVHLTPSAVR